MIQDPMLPVRVESSIRHMELARTQDIKGAEVRREDRCHPWLPIEVSRSGQLVNNQGPSYQYAQLEDSVQKPLIINRLVIIHRTRGP